MVNEDIYESIVESLKKAKEQLEKAKDLRAFAKEAGIPITISDAEIADLEARIKAYEEALMKRGYVLV